MCVHPFPYRALKGISFLLSYLFCRSPVLVQKRYEKVRMRFLSRLLDFVRRPEFLISRIHDVSDTGPVSVFKVRRKTPTTLDPLERAN
jgi:hypothetical protein